MQCSPSQRQILMFSIMMLSVMIFISKCTAYCLATSSTFDARLSTAMSWGILLRWLLWSGYPSGLGLAMRVREMRQQQIFAHTCANIAWMRMCASLRIRMCASLRIRKSDAWPSLIRTVSAGGLYIGMLPMQWFWHAAWSRRTTSVLYLGCIIAIQFGDALL